MRTQIDFDFLRHHVANGVLRVQKHPTLPLEIVNYSQKCQYEKLWDDVTLQCRGLVIHGDTVVARPFRKFFNDTEHREDEIPWHLPCEITEKLDGSLLIVFNFADEWHFATRGSFTSEQSQRGKEIFERHYGDIGLNPNLTYLFEVIYPQNRIVVNYGDREDVVLLAVIDTESGTELPLPRTNTYPLFTCVRSLPPAASAKELRSLITDDQEGYVVRFENGFRVKVKGERYMQLHRLICGTSSRTIWETLSKGESFEDMFEVIPDEFGDWVKRERDSLLSDYQGLTNLVHAAHESVAYLPDRKSQAMKLIAMYPNVSSAVFAKLDGKPWDHIIWKQLYPEFRRPEIVERVEA